MPKTVTLRLDEPVYRLFKEVAERENRPLSNFIETAVMRFVLPIVNNAPGFVIQFLEVGFMSHIFDELTTAA